MQPLSFETDLSCVDGLETVTLRQPGADSGVAISEALRRPLTSGAGGTREAAPSAGVYTRSDVRWLLAARQVPEPPRLGAKVVDAAGVEWTVLMAEPTALGSRWVLWCRALDLAHGLDQRVNVERATWSKSPSGAMSAAWQTWRVALPARLQPISLATASEHGQRFARATHRVYLAEALPIDSNCRIVHDGRAYHVLGCRMLERIDHLLEIDCERSPWPLGRAEGAA